MKQLNLSLKGYAVICVVIYFPPEPPHLDKYDARAKSRDCSEPLSNGGSYVSPCAAVGWAMAERMTATLVCDALKMALWRRKNPTEVIVHSDRGVQYCSKEYQDLLDKYGLFCSMSKKGDCFDN